MTIIIGLTGNIGTGKSTALQMLAAVKCRSLTPFRFDIWQWMRPTHCLGGHNALTGWRCEDADI